MIHGFPPGSNSLSLIQTSLGSVLLPPPGSASSSSSLRITLLLDCLDGFWALSLDFMVWNPQALARSPGSHLSKSGVPSPGVSENHCW